MSLTLDSNRNEYVETDTKERYPRVTTVLVDMGLLNTRWYTMPGRDRGTAVHDGCHLMAENRLDWATVHPEILPYLRAFDAFRTDVDFRYLSGEKNIKNTLLRYAGRYDMLAIVNGKLTLIDLKSSATLLPCVRLQLAAYQLCVPERPERLALLLKADATYTPETFPEDGIDAAAWQGAVALWHWMRRHKIRRSG